MIPLVHCAAIRKDGKVYTGRRHADIFHANAVRENGIIVSHIADGQQGFVDANGCFLTREEAADRALNFGQITALKYSKTQLFSEDLY